MARPDIDSYFMEIANTVATRATCDRKHVGAVVVRNKNILATGYNGSISGLEHCDQIGHLMENDHCIRTVHAEVNAIAQAAKHGISLDKATIYINASPCWNCFKVIANSGIIKIVYGENYRTDQKVIDSAKLSNIELIHFGSQKYVA